MTDQAAGLRQIASAVDPASNRPAVIAITSGKGGVGKTNIVANLSLALLKHQQRVLVMDADYGLANIDVLLALSPPYHLGHVLFGEKTLEEVIVKGPGGLEIIPAGSGIQELTSLTPDQEKRLFAAMSGLRDKYDFLIIDTAAGISKNVIRLLLASSMVVVVTQPEPTAIVDAYAMVKVITRNHPDQTFPVKLLVNSVSGAEEAEAVYSQIRSACMRFLKRDVELLGYVPWDDALASCVREQKPVLQVHPNSRASRQFMSLAKTIMADWKRDPRRANAVFWSESFRRDVTLPAET